jgi:hypothetical protein
MFIIIVKIFPTIIDGRLKIESTIEDKLNTIIIIKMLPINEIKDIIRVAVRAHDLPFNKP